MATKTLKAVLADLTTKEALVDADYFMVGDSQDEGNLKKVPKSSLGKGYKEYIGYVTFSDPDIIVRTPMVNDFDVDITITKVVYNGETFYHVNTGLDYVFTPESTFFGYQKVALFPALGASHYGKLKNDAGFTMNFVLYPPYLEAQYSQVNGVFVFTAYTGDFEGVDILNDIIGIHFRVYD